VGGKTTLLRRLYKRSMIKANATTEHINKGQIGQPAACMIPNKSVSPNIVCDYRPACHFLY
jgi:hypothetical protein